MDEILVIGGYLRTLDLEVMTETEISVINTLYILTPELLVSKDITPDELLTILQRTVEDIVVKKLNSIKKQTIKDYTGKDITDAQLDIYRSKYKLAKEAIENDDFNVFETEALLKESDPKDITDAIISIGDDWEVFYDTLNVNIDSIRVGIMHVFNNEDTDYLKTIKQLSILNNSNNIEEFLENTKEVVIDTTVLTEEDLPEYNEDDIVIFDDTLEEEISEDDIGT